MRINPNWSLIFGCVITVASVVSNTPALLNHAVPDAWIPTIVAWNGIVATVGIALLTVAHGFSAPQPGILASPPK